jgi:hypothetical protein
MARHLQWADDRVREEIADTERTLQRHLARATADFAATPPAAEHGAMLARLAANAVAQRLESDRIQ